MYSRILICGGRAFTNAVLFANVMQKLQCDRIISDQPFVIEGGANGADTLAREWATNRGFPVATVRANWKLWPRQAGPIRNAWMLRLEPDLVIAFPGGAGTQNMADQAHRHGVTVFQVSEHGDVYLPFGRSS